MHLTRKLAGIAATVALAASATNACAKITDTAYLVLLPLLPPHPPCVDTVALTLPVNVTLSAYVSVSARTTYSVSFAAEDQADVWVELRDSGNTTVATSQKGFAAVGSSYKSTIVSDGLLHQGTSKSDATAQIFTAAPGNYTLQMHVFAYGGGDGSCNVLSVPRFEDLTLSYTLLSPG